MHSHLLVSSTLTENVVLYMETLRLPDRHNEPAFESEFNPGHSRAGAHYGRAGPDCSQQEHLGQGDLESVSKEPGAAEGTGRDLGPRQQSGRGSQHVPVLR